MQVYRITLQKWAKALHASGYPARWNSRGQFVIYAAGTRSLAALENVVHRSGVGLNQLFKVMVIEYPDNIAIEELPVSKMPTNWSDPAAYSRCQPLGDTWIKGHKSAILRVPSAIVPKEFNYLINPNHPDFSKVKLLRTEDFIFDPRIKKDS